jgi:hypothetical protein
MEKSKYYNDRVLRGKVESNFSIVKKMSQNHANKKANQDYKDRGSGFGIISNIERTIIKMWMRDDGSNELKNINDPDT